jgi:hypothetical protein
MIGKIIGGIVGAKLAKSEPGGLQGPGGAVLGIGAAALARRLSLPAMLAVAAGGYALKRYKDKQDRRASKRPKVRPSAA